MQRKNLFNDGWEFFLAESGAGIAAAENAEYAPVDIPHDWLIYDTDNLYKSGDGLYRKFFEADDIYSHSYILCFDGVYMDCTVYVNGTEAVSWTHGYTSFGTDISALLNEGRNRIDVLVRYKSPNSRWYSGAGIFRNVWLYELSPVHLNINGIYISPDAETGDIYINTETVGVSSAMPPLEVRHTAFDESGNIIAQGRSPVTWSCNEFTIHADDIRLWSLEERNLYTLRTELAVIQDGTVLDCDENTFGFRKLRFDPDFGFFLNGKNIKLKGVCLHHDLGCLGAAFNSSALERQLMIMKDMGVNSVRTSHNPPAAEFMEICDRIGLLVDSECFDMWELHKTEFDNARFFKDTAHRDVKSWVKRDRNHPSLIMWSIGNEILDTHVDEHGYETAEQLAGYVKESDYKGNAKPTIASNYIEWENAQKVGKMLGISGYNYTERCYDDHHKKYPRTVIYGSETASALRSRGIYHFPADIPKLTHADNQCSSLGNSTARWGSTAEDAWTADRDRPFCMGQYVWSGFDYIGEPTPYETRSCYFGAVDTAGIPKDIYYFYKSVWTDEPMIHLLPYWDFSEGQETDVIAYTNAPCAELFLNGVSQGKQYIDHEHGKVLHCQWKVRYTAGEITAKAYDDSGNMIAEETRRSFGDAARLRVAAERDTVKADGRDVVFVIISAEDKDGNPVENARNRFTVKVTGAGRLAGTDNGDPTDTDGYRSDCRRLFSGKAAAAVMSGTEAGDITVTVTSEGLGSAEATIRAEKVPVPAGVSAVTGVPCSGSTDKEIPIRTAKLSCGLHTLTPDTPECDAAIEIFPANRTYDDISCAVLKANGTKSDCAEAVYADGKIHITAKGDGEAVLTVFCMNGGKYPQLIAEMNFSCEGFGQTLRSPYEYISAAEYSSSPDTFSITEGNSVGAFGDNVTLYFDGTDFGKHGSERIELYIGNSSGKDVIIDILDGERTITAVNFPHNGLWNSFAPMTFALPEKLKGVHTLGFRIRGRCLFGGSEFVSPVFGTIFPADCDELYGDCFTKDGSSVRGIGNNTVIGFRALSFGSGADAVIIRGSTPNEINTIQMKISKDGAETTHLLEFRQNGGHEQQFGIPEITGVNDVDLVFLPGSDFDLDSFSFVKKEETPEG